MLGTRNRGSGQTVYASGYYTIRGLTASVATLPSAGKLQRGVPTGLDIDVFGSLKVSLVVRLTDHCLLEPVCALADDSAHKPFTLGFRV